MPEDPVFAYRDPGAAGAGEGPLLGLRVAMQPNLSVAGWPADAGSNALAGFRALEDATMVQRLRQAGAMLCGYTRASEFGFGLRGSQAGSAVTPGPSGSAVAPGPSGSAVEQEADAELVLDLMGESRLAAARAGVCGFKPSYGIVSRYGLIGFIPSMECCGVLSRSLKTVRGLLQAMAGQDGLDYSLPDEGIPDLSPQEIDPGKTAIGVVAEACAGLPPEQAEGFRAAAGELAKAGFTIHEMSFPDFPLFALVHRIAGSVEASSCAGRYDSVRYGPRAPGARNWNEMYLRSRGAAFGPLVKSYLFQGAFFQFERYGAFEDACRIRARLLAGMRQLTSHADFLLLPAGNGARAALQDAPASLPDTYAEFAATLFANVTGQPALYLPPRSSALPGFQLAGPRRGDARLLALGEHLLARLGGSL